MAKVIVITGATGGIGGTIFDRLMAAGHVVYGCGRSDDARETIRQVDVSKPAEVAAWADWVRRRSRHVDLLINNAAIVGSRKRFEDTDDSMWEQALATNVMGPVRVTRSFLPMLRGSNGATIVNIGSVLGKFGRAGWATYATSKFALEGLGQVLAQELYADGVRVVTLHPSRISTRLRNKLYPMETLGVEGEQNVESVISAIEFLLANQDRTFSGLSLSANDFIDWTRR